MSATAYADRGDTADIDTVTDHPAKGVFSVLKSSRVFCPHNGHLDHIG
jgi:hypothetical protein